MSRRKSNARGQLSQAEEDAMAESLRLMVAERKELTDQAALIVKKLDKCGSAYLSESKLESDLSVRESIVLKILGGIENRILVRENALSSMNDEMQLVVDSNVREDYMHAHHEEIEEEYVLDPALLNSEINSSITNKSDLLNKLFHDGKKQYDDFILASLSIDENDIKGTNEEINAALVPMLQKKVKHLLNDIEIQNMKMTGIGVQWAADRAKFEDMKVHLNKEMKQMAVKLQIAESRKRLEDQSERDENFVVSAVSKQEWQQSVEKIEKTGALVLKLDAQRIELDTDLKRVQSELLSANDELRKKGTATAIAESKLDQIVKKEENLRQEFEKVIENYEKQIIELNLKYDQDCRSSEDLIISINLLKNERDSFQSLFNEQKSETKLERDKAVDFENKFRKLETLLEKLKSSNKEKSAAQLQVNNSDREMDLQMQLDELTKDLVIMASTCQKIMLQMQEFSISSEERIEIEINKCKKLKNLHKNQVENFRKNKKRIEIEDEKKKEYLEKQKNKHEVVDQKKKVEVVEQDDEEDNQRIPLSLNEKQLARIDREKAKVAADAANHLRELNLKIKELEHENARLSEVHAAGFRGSENEIPRSSRSRDYDHNDDDDDDDDEVHVKVKKIEKKKKIVKITPQTDAAKKVIKPIKKVEKKVDSEKASKKDIESENEDIEDNVIERNLSIVDDSKVVENVVENVVEIDIKPHVKIVGQDDDKHVPYDDTENEENIRIQMEELEELRVALNEQQEEQEALRLEQEDERYKLDKLKNTCDNDKSKLESDKKKLLRQQKELEDLKEKFEKEQEANEETYQRKLKLLKQKEQSSNNSNISPVQVLQRQPQVQSEIKDVKESIETIEPVNESISNFVEDDDAISSEPIDMSKYTNHPDLSKDLEKQQSIVQKLLKQVKQLEMDLSNEKKESFLQQAQLQRQLQENQQKQAITDSISDLEQEILDLQNEEMQAIQNIENWTKDNDDTTIKVEKLKKSSLFDNDNNSNAAELMEEKKHRIEAQTKLMKLQQQLQVQKQMQKASQMRQHSQDPDALSIINKQKEINVNSANIDNLKEQMENQKFQMQKDLENKQIQEMKEFMAQYQMQQAAIAMMNGDKRPVENSKQMDFFIDMKRKMDEKDKKTGFVFSENVSNSSSQSQSRNGSKTEVDMHQFLAMQQMLKASQPNSSRINSARGQEVDVEQFLAYQQMMKSQPQSHKASVNGESQQVDVQAYLATQQFLKSLPNSRQSSAKGERQEVDVKAMQEFLKSQPISCKSSSDPKTQIKKSQEVDVEQFIAYQDSLRPLTPLQKKIIFSQSTQTKVDYMQMTQLMDSPRVDMDQYLAMKKLIEEQQELLDAQDNNSQVDMEQLLAMQKSLESRESSGDQVDMEQFLAMQKLLEQRELEHQVDMEKFEAMQKALESKEYPEENPQFDMEDFLAMQELLKSNLQCRKASANGPCEEIDIEQFIAMQEVVKSSNNSSRINSAHINSARGQEVDVEQFLAYQQMMKSQPQSRKASANGESQQVDLNVEQFIAIQKEVKVLTSSVDIEQFIAKQKDIKIQASNVMSSQTNSAESKPQVDMIDMEQFLAMKQALALQSQGVNSKVNTVQKITMALVEPKAASMKELLKLQADKKAKDFVQKKEKAQVKARPALVLKAQSKTVNLDFPKERAVKIIDDVKLKKENGEALLQIPWIPKDKISDLFDEDEINNEWCNFIIVLGDQSSSLISSAITLDWDDKKLKTEIDNMLSIILSSAFDLSDRATENNNDNLGKINDMLDIMKTIENKNNTQALKIKALEATIVKLKAVSKPVPVAAKPLVKITREKAKPVTPNVSDDLLNVPVTEIFDTFEVDVHEILEVPQAPIKNVAYAPTKPYDKNVRAKIKNNNDFDDFLMIEPVKQAEEVTLIPVIVEPEFIDNTVSVEHNLSEEELNKIMSIGEVRAENFDRLRNKEFGGDTIVKLTYLMHHIMYDDWNDDIDDEEDIDVDKKSIKVTEEKKVGLQKQSMRMEAKLLQSEIIQTYSISELSRFKQTTDAHISKLFSFSVLKKLKYYNDGGVFMDVLTVHRDVLNKCILGAGSWPMAMQEIKKHQVIKINDTSCWPDFFRIQVLEYYRNDLLKEYEKLENKNKESIQMNKAMQEKFDTEKMNLETEKESIKKELDDLLAKKRGKKTEKTTTSQPVKDELSLKSNSLLSIIKEESKSKIEPIIPIPFNQNLQKNRTTSPVANNLPVSTKEIIMLRKIHNYSDKIITRVLNNEIEAVDMAEGVLEGLLSWKDGFLNDAIESFQKCEENHSNDEDIILCQDLLKLMTVNNVDFKGEIREITTKLEAMLDYAGNVKEKYAFYEEHYIRKDLIPIPTQLPTANVSFTTPEVVETKNSQTNSETQVSNTISSQNVPQTYTPLEISPAVVSAPKDVNQPNIIETRPPILTNITPVIINPKEIKSSSNLMSVVSTLTAKKESGLNQGMKRALAKQQKLEEERLAIETELKVKKRIDDAVRIALEELEVEKMEIETQTDPEVVVSVVVDTAIKEDEVKNVVVEEENVEKVEKQKSPEKQVENHGTADLEELGVDFEEQVEWAKNNFKETQSTSLPPGFKLADYKNREVELCPGVMLASLSYLNLNPLEIPKGVVYVYRDKNAPYAKGLKLLPGYIKVPKIPITEEHTRDGIVIEACLIPPSFNLNDSVKLIYNVNLGKSTQLDLPTDIVVLQMMRGSSVPLGLTIVEISTIYKLPAKLQLPSGVDAVQMHTQVVLPVGIEVSDGITIEQTPPDITLPANVCLIRRDLPGQKLPSFMTLLSATNEAKSELSIQDTISEGCYIVQKPQGIEFRLGVEILFRPVGQQIPIGMRPLSKKEYPDGLQLGSNLELVSLTPRFDFPETCGPCQGWLFYPRPIGIRLDPYTYLIHPDVNDPNGGKSLPDYIHELPIPELPYGISLPKVVIAMEFLPGVALPLPPGTILGPGLVVLSPLLASAKSLASQSSSLRNNLSDMRSPLPVNAVLVLRTPGAKIPIGLKRGHKSDLPKDYLLGPNMEVFLLSVRFELPIGVKLGPKASVGRFTQLTPGTILARDLEVCEWPRGFVLPPGCELVKIASGTEVPMGYQQVPIPAFDTFFKGIPQNTIVVQYPENMKLQSSRQLAERIHIVNSRLELANFYKESLPPGVVLIKRELSNLSLPSDLTVIPKNLLPSNLRKALQIYNIAVKGMKLEAVQLPEHFSFPANTELYPGVFVCPKPHWLTTSSWIELVSVPKNNKKSQELIDYFKVSPRPESLNFFGDSDDQDIKMNLPPDTELICVPQDISVHSWSKVSINIESVVRPDNIYLPRGHFIIERIQNKPLPGGLRLGFAPGYEAIKKRINLAPGLEVMYILPNYYLPLGIALQQTETLCVQKHIDIDDGSISYSSVQFAFNERISLGVASIPHPFGWIAPIYVDKNSQNNEKNNDVIGSPMSFIFVNPTNYKLPAGSVIVSNSDQLVLDSFGDYQYDDINLNGMKLLNKNEKSTGIKITDIIKIIKLPSLILGPRDRLLDSSSNSNDDEENNTVSKKIIEKLVDGIVTINPIINANNNLEISNKEEEDNNALLALAVGEKTELPSAEVLVDALETAKMELNSLEVTNNQLRIANIAAERDVGYKLAKITRQQERYDLLEKDFKKIREQNSEQKSALAKKEMQLKLRLEELVRKQEEGVQIKANLEKVIADLEMQVILWKDALTDTNDMDQKSAKLISKLTTDNQLKLEENLKKLEEESREILAHFQDTLCKLSERIVKDAHSRANLSSEVYLNNKHDEVPSFTSYQSSSQLILEMDNEHIKPTGFLKDDAWVEDDLLSVLSEDNSHFVAPVEKSVHFADSNSSAGNSNIEGEYLSMVSTLKPIAGSVNSPMLKGTSKHLKAMRTIKNQNKDNTPISVIVTPSMNNDATIQTEVKVHHNHTPSDHVYLQKRKEFQNVKLDEFTYDSTKASDKIKNLLDCYYSSASKIEPVENPEVDINLNSKVKVPFSSNDFGRKLEEWAQEILAQTLVFKDLEINNYLKALEHSECEIIVLLKLFKQTMSKCQHLQDELDYNRKLVITDSDLIETNRDLVQKISDQEIIISKYSLDSSKPKLDIIKEQVQKLDNLKEMEQQLVFFQFISKQKAIEYENNSKIANTPDNEIKALIHYAEVQKKKSNVYYDRSLVLKQEIEELCQNIVKELEEFETVAKTIVPSNIISTLIKNKSGFNLKLKPGDQNFGKRNFVKQDKPLLFPPLPAAIMNKLKNQNDNESIGSYQSKLSNYSTQSSVSTSSKLSKTSLQSSASAPSLDLVGKTKIPFGQPGSMPNVASKISKNLQSFKEIRLNSNIIPEQQIGQSGISGKIVKKKI